MRLDLRKDPVVVGQTAGEFFRSGSDHPSVEEDHGADLRFIPGGQLGLDVEHPAEDLDVLVDPGHHIRYSHGQQ